MKSRVCPCGIIYFNPRPPRGGRPAPGMPTGTFWVFQSTPPARGATGARKQKDRQLRDFNPRPPRGGRHLIDFVKNLLQGNFNPRPPRGGRRHPAGYVHGKIFISIHAPREGGDSKSVVQYPGDPPISIHAPREGGDWARSRPRKTPAYFNPRPPRGGRPGCQPRWRRPQRFQSTPPRGGRLRRHETVGKGGPISIHAPREGGDFGTVASIAMAPIFQSTPPARGATPRISNRPQAGRISIHAPREGGDATATVWLIKINISIHAPREGGDDQTL